MKPTASLWRACGLACLEAIQIALVGAGAALGQQGDYLGPSCLVAARDGRTLYVALADAHQVAWVDVATGGVVRRVDVPAEPSGLALTPDGAKLIVTCAGPRSSVVVLDPVSGQVTATVPAGHTAMAPVVTPDGTRLYVCNRFDNDVSVIDLARGAETGRVKAVREPVAAAVTPDGKSVLVANHLPNTRSDSFLPGTVAAAVTVIETATNQASPILLPRGSFGLRGLCISADGRHAFVTHLLCNFELIPMQVDIGWTNSN